MVPLLVLASVSASFGWLLAVALLAPWPLWRLVQLSGGYEAIGCDDNGQWWLQRAGQRQLVRWHAGSVRRAGLLVLYPSPWPWQGLVIRRQHCTSDDEFRRLKVALYSSF